MFVRDFQGKRDVGQWLVPEGYVFDPNLCYENGDPVIIKLDEPFVVRIGRRKFARITIAS